MEQVPVALIALIVSGVAVIAFAASRYKVAKPNEALIIAGSRRSKGGIRVVVGGGAIVYPLINVARRISLEVRSISVGLNAAVTTHGVPIAVEGIVNVKIADDEDSIRQASQRFLESQESISDIVRNVMEGSLRTIIGQLSVDELIRDREQFASRVQAVAAGDLTGTGLVIDVFTIQSISDHAQYIENLGRKAAAEVKRDAEIAEAEMSREAREKQELAQQAVLEAAKNTQLKQQAINREIATAQAQAEQAKPLADAQAKKEVVTQETEVADLVAKRREKELNAEVRAVAEANRYAAEQQADAEKYTTNAQTEAEATSIRQLAESRAFEQQSLGEAEASAIKAKGSAEASAMNEKAEAYKNYDNAAVLEMLISRIPEVAEAVASPLANVDTITVIDTEGASKLPKTIASTIGQLDPIVEALTGKSLTDRLSTLTGTDDPPRPARPGVPK